MKHRAYHSWQWVFRNPADFTQISPVKSTQNYKSKCFSKNSSVWWMQDGGFHPWNLVDFTHEIQWISPRFHLWNPPKIIKASVSAKTLQFDECRVGAMTKDFMKSAWNPHEIRRFHELWAFVWWSSIGLSTFERPNSCKLDEASGWSCELLACKAADVWSLFVTTSCVKYRIFMCKTKCYIMNFHVTWIILTELFSWFDFLEMLSVIFPKTSYYVATLLQ